MNTMMYTMVRLTCADEQNPSMLAIMRGKQRQVERVLSTPAADPDESWSRQCSWQQHLRSRHGGTFEVVLPCPDFGGSMLPCQAAAARRLCGNAAHQLRFSPVLPPAALGSLHDTLQHVKHAVPVQL